MDNIAKRQRPGLRAAIDSKCRDCACDPLCGGGTWREQIAQCTCLDCALWPVRPAPTTGPFANPYRNAEGVPPEWVRLPVGLAFSPHPTADLGQPERGALGGQP